MGGMPLPNRLVVLVYAIACLILLAVVGSWDDVETIIFGVVVYVWMVSPVIGLAMLRLFPPVPAIGAAILGLLAMYMYWRGFFGPDMDAQSGLLFIFLPFCQWIVVGAVALVMLLLSEIPAKE